MVVILDKTDKSEGGVDDLYNDCLYDCLKKVLHNTVKERWSNPRKLKTALSIHRDAMVNAGTHMDRIENWLGVQINITGDIIRLPKINAKTSINLILKENHYTLQPHIKNKVKGISYQERELLTVFFDKENMRYITYNGEEITEKNKRRK